MNQAGHARAQAIFNYILWFSAGGFVAAAVTEYVPFLNSDLSGVIGGLIVAEVTRRSKA